MAVSQSRAAYLESIRELKERAESLAARYSMTQLSWQPAAGERWSMLECLDHLAIANDIYLDAMQSAVMEARPGAEAGILRSGGFLTAKMISTLEPPPGSRSKMPAPAKIQPRPTLKPENILPQFLRTLGRTESMIASSSAKDLNAVKFRNPLVKFLRFSVSSGFLIIAAHSRRHLWQAEQIALDPNFPA